MAHSRNRERAFERRALFLRAATRGPSRVVAIFILVVVHLRALCAGLAILSNDPFRSQVRVRVAGFALPLRFPHIAVFEFFDVVPSLPFFFFFFLS